MEVLETIKKRSSIRKYTDQMLDDVTLKTLIEAALQAPTATNRQEVDVTVLRKGNPILAELDDEVYAGRENRPTSFYYDAPVLLILSAEKAFRFSHIDSGIAVENVSLAAEGLGLGSLIIGCIWKCFAGPKGDYYREALKFKEGYDFTIAIALGYRDTEKDQHLYDFDSKVTYLD